VGAGALVVSVSPAPSSAGIGSDIAVEFGSAGGEGPPRELAQTENAIDDLPRAMVVDPGGGERPAHPDTDRGGRGGSPRVNTPALNLAESDEGVTLSRDPTSRVDRDQLQRLDTARVRESIEDRRSLRDPMDLVFLAMGSGQLKERRPSADRDPDRGAFRAPPWQHLGAGTVQTPDAEPSGDLRRHDSGTALASPGLGTARNAPGPHHRAAAAVSTGRPLVTRGPVAFAAEDQGPSQDRMDSEQEVAATVESMVHASTAGGLPGHGEGGEEGEGAAASGGPSSAGLRALPFGGGPGPFTAWSQDDPRVSDYWRSVRAKIDPLWEHAFPEWASLEGRQGWAVISFVVRADGQVADVRVARPSGVSEFDENLRRAVLKAAPFAPFPPAITAPAMRWSITFDMKNPAVR
jgi:TonB family protein